MRHGHYPFRLLPPLLLLFVFCCLYTLTASDTAESQTTTTTRPLAVDTVANLWLSLEVETSWGWFWQKTTGKAFVTVGKNSPVRHPVGKLYVRLVAHDSTQKVLANADSIVIFEKKKGLGIPRRTAYLTAWTEDPALDTTRVHIAP